MLPTGPGGQTEPLPLGSRRRPDQAHQRAQRRRTPAAGAVAGPYDWMKPANLPLSAAGGGPADGYYTQDTHVISADGTRSTSPPSGSGALYVRLNPAASQSPLEARANAQNRNLACTLQVSASSAASPIPWRAPRRLHGRHPDGKTVFFASPEKLTDDANTGPTQPPPGSSAPKPPARRSKKNSPGSSPRASPKTPNTSTGPARRRTRSAAPGSKAKTQNRPSSQIPPLKVEDVGPNRRTGPGQTPIRGGRRRAHLLEREGEGKGAEG